LKVLHQEKQHHLELYNDESPFVNMEIFKDVVGLTREQLEKVKEGKKLKKIPKNQPCDVTVGAKFLRTPQSLEETSVEVSADEAEYHVNDQEPFYDCGSSITGENSLIHLQDQSNPKQNGSYASNHQHEMRINDNLSHGEVEELFRDHHPDDPEADTDSALLKKLQVFSQISELHSSGHLLDLSQQHNLSLSRRIDPNASNIKHQGKTEAKATKVQVIESRRGITPNDPEGSTERKKVGQIGSKTIEFPSFDLSMSKIEL